MTTHRHRRSSVAARQARWLAATVAGTAGIFLTASALGQTADRKHKAPTIQCDECHTCKEPTREASCLRTCPRNSAMKTAEEFSARRGPSLVILDELEDLYLPVPFDHRGHADMAQMTRGCSVCHHYTPEGLEHPACKTCHEIAPLQVDIRKPGLKGAYHRQCMSCHREWSGETSCGVCHQPKAGAAKKGSAVAPPTKDDLMGRMHPPIPEPEVEVYQTKWEGDTSSRVQFRHKAHIHSYDLRCSDCHHEDNCTRCHEEGKEHTQHVRTLDEHHKPCFDCHRTTPCDGCHYAEGKPSPSPFEHACTGWPLKRYHAEKNCRACHLTVPYSRMDKDCNSCHSNWTPANFDHAITGQQLDDNHVRLECDGCHVDRAFERPPRCDQCHEPEEGISFPVKRPGRSVLSTGK